jgi:predicted dehydrogenase
MPRAAVPLAWGIIGTGSIAADFARALRGSKRCRIASVCGSSPEKSAQFARRHGVPRAARSLEELCGDPAVQAVYVATPHTLHEPHTLAAIDAGKHVLCEKPLAMNAVSAERMIEAARRRGTFLMEAFMYRCHPLVRELAARLAHGEIGEVRHVRADFGFRTERNPSSRLFASELGGGAILDVGCYPMSLARLVAGVVEGGQFAEPARVVGTGFLGPLGADELATAELTFPSGVTAQLTCAVRHAVGTRVVIFGERGRIVLPNPWLPEGRRLGRAASLCVHVDGHDVRAVEVRAQSASYALEAELVADTLPAQEATWPAMIWADTLGNMRALDAWRAATTSG